MKRSRGFTLVEVLVVIGIVALLIGILVPVLSRSREAARRTGCATNLRGIGQAILTYAMDHKNMYPRVRFKPDYVFSPSGGPSQPRGEVPADAPNPFFDNPDYVNDPVAAMFLLVRNGYITADKFICPSTEDQPDEFDGKKPLQRSNFTQPSPGISAGQSRGWANRSYSYSFPYPSVQGVRNGMKMTLQSVPPSFAVMADFGGFPLCALNEDTEERHSKSSGRKGNSLNHRQVGQNVLFADGSVKWSITNACGVNGDNIYISKSGGNCSLTQPADPTDSCMEDY